MGNAGIRQAGAQALPDPRVYLQNDFPKFIFQEKIGNGKFTKSFLMKIDGTLVTVKVYLKPTDEDLQKYAANLTWMWKSISPADFPNLLPYQMWIKSDQKISKASLTPVYLVRQYFPSNLYDRLSTRPFLINLEKLWIMYQIMKALEQSHEQGVVHGDIKPENILTTSWNWAVLTDFAPQKPVAIPDDDTATFHYFFDSMSRRRCYIAPERFYTSGRKLKSAKASASLDVVDEDESKTPPYPPPSMDKKGEETLTPAMDVFSLGCTFAEVLLDGECLIDLPSMLQYLSLCREKKEGEPNICLSDDDSPALSTLNRIKDPRIRKTISLMTQYAPGDRLSVSSYRKILEEKGVFPSFFSTVLYDLFIKLHWHGTTPDDRVNIICENYRAIIMDIADCMDEDGARFFTSVLKFLHRGDPSAAAHMRIDRADELNSSVGPSAVSTHIAEHFHHLRTSKILDGPDAPPRPLYSSKIDIPGANEFYGRKDSGNNSQVADEILRNVKKTLREDDTNQSTAPLSLGRLINEFEKLLIPEHASNRDVKDGYVDEKENQDNAPRRKEYDESVIVDEDTKLFNHSKISQRRSKKNIIAGDGVFLVIQIICSSIRYMRHPESKVVSLMLMSRLGMFCQDTVKLRRVVPFVLCMLEDSIPTVRAAAIRTLKSLVLSVTELQPLEANIFEQCIFPALSKKLIKDPEILVKVTFAESMGMFAEASKRFLNMTELSRLAKISESEASSGISDTSVSEELLENQYDAKLHHLHEIVSKWIRDLILDSGMADATDVSSRCIIRRAILKDLIRYCSFFGTRERIMDMLLVHILSYVNHPDWECDWELRRDFCIHIPSVCAFLGQDIASEWVLPCIENVRIDVEEIVAAASIQCVTSLIKMNLLSTSVVHGCFQKNVPLLVHPCPAIRESCIDMTVAIAGSFGVVDAYVFVLPYIRPFLKCDLIGFELSRENLNVSLVAPLSRKAYQTRLREETKATGALNAATSEDDLSTSGILVDFPDSKKKVDVHSANVVNGSTEVKVANDSEPDEARLLGLLEEYIKGVGQNVNSRRSHWERENKTHARNSIRLDAKNKRGRKSVTSLPNSLTLGSTINGLRTIHLGGDLLDPFSFQTAQGLSEVHSVLVPNQKYSLNTSTTEAIRSLANEKSDHLINDFSMLQKMYGVVSKMSTVGKHEQRAESSMDVTISNGDDTAGDIDVQSLHRVIKSLRIPPLAPDLGNLVQPIDGRKFSTFVESLDPGLSYTSESTANQQWRPKENTVVATMYEHSQAVNRIAVATDQTFFVSASSDSTAKVWQMKGIERHAFPKSALTYRRHKGKIIDMTMVENSHSVATCSDDGSIHVWRVDLECNDSDVGTSGNSHMSGGNGGDGNIGSVARPISTAVRGSTVIKRIEQGEGPIVGIQNYTTDVASILTYCTLKGKIHSWDLRSSEEPFTYTIRPELGFPTSMTVSPDRNWMCVGTSKGFISLWDIRYSVMSKLWKHSAGLPIHRLASAKGSNRSNANAAGRQDILPNASGGYLFVAAGLNETSVWGIPDGGECLKCFRSVPMLASSRSSPADLPNLVDIPIPSRTWAPFKSSHVSSGGSDFFNSYIDPSEKTLSVRAIMGRISHSATSYVITAGTDHHIRYWDFNTPSRCFTVSGLHAAQPKPVYESPSSAHVKGKLFVCYDSKVPTPEATLQAQIPLREYRGVTSPLVSSQDAVLDLKGVEFPVKMLLSCGRDGIIKLWR